MDRKISNRKTIYQPKNTFRAKEVYKGIALQALHKQWYESAIHNFCYVEELTSEPKEWVEICLYKSQAQRALGNMHECKYEAYKALALNNDRDIMPYLNLANVLYQENEYEDALDNYNKGFKKSNKPEFETGVIKTMNTLQNCVGDYAGSMFDRDGLGKAVMTIKKEQLGIATPTKKLTFTEELVRAANLKKTEKYIGIRYLDKIAYYKQYLYDLSDNNVLGSQNKDAGKNIYELTVDNAIRKLETKQNALWHRSPLYYFYNKVKDFQASSYAQEFLAHIKNFDNEMLDRTIVQQITELFTLKDNNNFSECFTKMLRIRDRLKYINRNQLPNRTHYLITLAKLLGEIHLSTKVLIQALSEELNDSRIKYALGVYKSDWPKSFEEVDHFHVTNPVETKIFFEKELINAGEHMTRAMLNFEIASLIYLTERNGNKMKGYCLDAINDAKIARNIDWFLVSVFLLAKSLLIDGRFDDGYYVLIANEQGCIIYERYEQAKFLNRALLLLQYLTPKDFIRATVNVNVEDVIIKTLPNIKLQQKFHHFLSSLNDLPKWGRMTLTDDPTEKKVAKVRPVPAEKMRPVDVMLFKTNWVSRFDDVEPYTVLDLIPAWKRDHRVNKVREDKRFNQFITIDNPSYAFV